MTADNIRGENREKAKSSTEQEVKKTGEDHGPTFRPLVFRKEGLKTTYPLALKGGAKRTAVEVTWTPTRCSRKGSLDDIEYRVVIQQVDNTGLNTYSLITLGIQSASYPVLIHEIRAPADGVIIDQLGKKEELKLHGQFELVKAEISGDGFTDGTVAFITFKGATCILIVSANAHRKLSTAWEDDPVTDVEPMGEHDNMPPGGTVER